MLPRGAWEAGGVGLPVPLRAPSPRKSVAAGARAEVGGDYLGDGPPFSPVRPVSPVSTVGPLRQDRPQLNNHRRWGTGRGDSSYCIFYFCRGLKFSIRESFL